MVAHEQIQAWLAKLFRCWGMPETIRVDNGLPFGHGGSDIPPPISMWIMGLGIKVHWNPPGKPQHNGVVENIQGLSGRWAEAHSCTCLEELQKRLDQVSIWQREVFKPVKLKGRTRTETFPELNTQKRPYSGKIDPIHIGQYLAKRCFSRKVSRTGQAYILGHRVSIGRQVAEQEVLFQFDAIGHQWKVVDQVGNLIKELQNPVPTVDSITNLKCPHNERKAQLNDTKK